MGQKILFGTLPFGKKSRVKNGLKIIENKVTRSPEISRQQVQQLTPPPLSTPALLSTTCIYPYLALFGTPNLQNNVGNSIECEENKT